MTSVKAPPSVDTPELAYAMEALVVELATDAWLSTLKVSELKPEAMPVLAGMLLAWHARAKALHLDVLTSVQMAKKGKLNATDQGRARSIQADGAAAAVRK